MEMEQLRRKSPFYFSEASATQLVLENGSASVFHDERRRKSVPRHMQRLTSPARVDPRSTTPILGRAHPLKQPCFPPIRSPRAHGDARTLSSYAGIQQPHTAEAAQHRMQAGGSQGSAAFLWPFYPWQHLRLFLNNFFKLFSAILGQPCGCG